MNAIVLKLRPFIVSVDEDVEVDLERRPTESLAAACDRVLALPSDAFPRQGVSEEYAKRAAATVKQHLARA